MSTGIPAAQPCPFCRGGQAHPFELDVALWAVNCPGCGAIGPAGPDQLQALSRWNDRQAATAPPGA